uniref:Signal transduction histidine kinase subgroup 3 dimerisation and phosphoacceptor domain-containing protein n=1 Tax=Thermodesulfobacterium geofontis TaxID=1295609 RepID=A0A7C4JR14_9BACT
MSHKSSRRRGVKKIARELHDEVGQTLL